MTITTTKLSHLGIVAGVFDELGIADIIDSAMPKTRDHHLPHSTIAKAMCVNGLGFVESRLYLYSAHFEDIPIERLLGEGVLPEYLNDDALGRTLDRFSEYGCTELFNHIALKAMTQVPIVTHTINTDTTNFSLYGDYKNSDSNHNTIEITYGHPKDMRWDLKRFVLSMVCNQDGIPLFVETLSENASDKKTLVQTIKNIQKGLKLSDKVYHIADSAIYSDDNITKLGKHTLWITRVPATITEAKNLLNADVELKVCGDSRYTYYETTSSYGGMKQKWILVQSKDMKKRKEKTYDRRVEKHLKATKTSLNKLKKIEYACEEDAKRGAEKWLSEHQGYHFNELHIESRSHRKDGELGRPKKDDVLEISYVVKAEIEADQERIMQERDKVGRFILTTNDLELTADEILGYYKSQSKIERGFRFLKDKSFHVSDVYLKKNGRIEALAMIMVLCLFLYSIAQWKLRE